MMRCIDCGGTHSRVIGFARGIRRCYPCANLYREVPTNPRTGSVKRNGLSTAPISKEAATDLYDTAPYLDRIAALFDGKE